MYRFYFILQKIIINPNQNNSKRKREVGFEPIPLLEYFSYTSNLSRKLKV